MAAPWRASSERRILRPSDSWRAFDSLRDFANRIRAEDAQPVAGLIRRAFAGITNQLGRLRSEGLSIC